MMQFFLRIKRLESIKVKTLKPEDSELLQPDHSDREKFDIAKVL